MGNCGSSRKRNIQPPPHIQPQQIHPPGVIVIPQIPQYQPPNFTSPYVTAAPLMTTYPTQPPPILMGSPIEYTPQEQYPPVEPIYDEVHYPSHPSSVIMDDFDYNKEYIVEEHPNLVDAYIPNLYLMVKKKL
ncbi:2167_t:CDS:2 [Cetraspora pellucida]|uniref:2167_t:CDS:1 n=1 Tax=Cetraspora pellucida TaxID=1433469 RepID=A0ACA9NU32_9GLOM|nr:2167_t:CDS:2 [Cetraspora pellucida]